MSEYLYRNEDWLREQYCQEGKTSYEIADEVGCDKTTILNWLKKFDIERQDSRGSRFDSDGRKSESWLREKYEEEQLSVPEIADIVGVTTSTIYDWMESFGVDRDPTRYGHNSRVEYATYYVDGQGYPRWQAKGRANGERVTDNFHVHRLLAIAQFGVDAVKDAVVHHKNGLKWDNRPGNVEVLSRSEHRRHHMNQRYEKSAEAE